MPERERNTEQKAESRAVELGMGAHRGGVRQAHPSPGTFPVYGRGRWVWWQALGGGGHAQVESGTTPRGRAK